MKYLFLLFLTSCGHCSPTPPPPSGPTCAEVCTRAATMGCDVAKPTAKGETCEKVCTEVEASGLIDLDLECRARAESCEAAEACEQ